MVDSKTFELSRRQLMISAAGMALASTSMPALGQDDKTIEIWMPGDNDKQGEWLAKVAKQFEKETPGLSVKPQILDWGAVTQRIAAAAAARSLPDIFFVYSSDMPTYAQAGALLPLDGIVDKSNIVDVGIQIGSWGGKWYGAPAGLDAPAFVYRKDFAKDAKLDPNAPPATWEQLAEWGRALTQRDSSGNLERAGLWLATGHPWVTFNQFMAMLYANGGTLFSADGMKSNLTSDAAVETVTFLAKLIREDKVVEPGLVQAENRDFADGRVASLISPIAVRGWDKDYAELNNLETVGFAPMPAGPKGVPGGIVTGGGLFLISANSKNPDLAAKLISKMTLDPATIGELTALDAAPPALKTNMIGDYLAQYPLAAEYHNLIEKFPRFYPKHPKFGAMYAPFNRALDNIYLTGADPKTEFSAAATAIDDIIQKSGIAVEESKA